MSWCLSLSINIKPHHHLTGYIECVCVCVCVCIPTILGLINYIVMNTEFPIFPFKNISYKVFQYIQQIDKIAIIKFGKYFLELIHLAFSYLSPETLRPFPSIVSTWCRSETDYEKDIIWMEEMWINTLLSCLESVF